MVGTSAFSPTVSVVDACRDFHIIHAPVERPNGAVEFVSASRGKYLIAEHAELEQITPLLWEDRQLFALLDLVRARQAGEPAFAGQVGAQAAETDSEVDPQRFAPLLAGHQMSFRREKYPHLSRGPVFLVNCRKRAIELTTERFRHHRSVTHRHPQRAVPEHLADRFDPHAASSPLHCERVPEGVAGRPWDAGERTDTGDQLVQ